MTGLLHLVGSMITCRAVAGAPKPSCAAPRRPMITRRASRSPRAQIPLLPLAGPMITRWLHGTLQDGTRCSPS